MQKVRDFVYIGGGKNVTKSRMRVRQFQFLRVISARVIFIAYLSKTAVAASATDAETRG